MKFRNCTSFLSILPLISCQLQDPQTYWSDYPACEEACHQSVWASQQCTLDTNICTCGASANCLCLQDECLCRAPKWLTAVAKCIGENCGASGVGDAASIVYNACTGEGIGLAVNSPMLVLIGLNAAATATGPRSTAATTVATTQLQGLSDTSTLLTSATSSFNEQTSPTLSPTSSSFSLDSLATTPLTTTSSSSTSNPTSTSSSGNSSGSSSNGSNNGSSGSSSSNGLTSSDKIALGVGLGVGFPPCIVAFWKLWTLCAAKHKGVK